MTAHRISRCATRLPRTSERTRFPAALAMCLAAGAAACSPVPPPTTDPSPTITTPTPTPVPVSSRQPSFPVPTPPQAARTATPTPTPVTEPALSGQVATSWGIAWDSIPTWFPRPDGSMATQTGGEPASAELDVPAAAGTVSEVADFYRVALEVGEYAYTIGGPLEDGSYVLDGSNRAACRFRVTVAPLGDHTLVRVFYGLGCRRG